MIDKVVEAVRKDLLDRSTVGIAKYGTTLDQNKGDLRYWLQHQYEELLDAANYCKRAIMELDNQKIPSDVFYSWQRDAFYHKNTRGMGDAFYKEWISRAKEFPILEFPKGGYF